MGRQPCFTAVFLAATAFVICFVSMQAVMSLSRVDPIDVPQPSFEIKLEGQSKAQQQKVSKLFEGSLQPSRILPYYYRASEEHLQNQVTVTTLINENRLPIFLRLVERWNGPISVTLHVPDSKKAKDQILRSLHTAWMSSEKFRRHVDVHLVVDQFERQFNLWRNIARYYARTEYVWMLDVDFYVCSDLKATLKLPEIQDLLKEKNTALVIPAFEYKSQEAGLYPSAFPNSKDELRRLYHSGSLEMFHSGWPVGHSATNHTRYFESKDVYRVENYTYSYEPYVIFPKNGPNYCSEKFVGYGSNKASCLFEMHVSGWNFKVLPNDFVIHQSHLYAEVARRSERRYNKLLYNEYRKETCFKYLLQFSQTGQLLSNQARNMLSTCEDEPDFKESMLQLMQENQYF